MQGSSSFELEILQSFATTRHRLVTLGQNRVWQVLVKRLGTLCNGHQTPSIDLLSIANVNLHFVYYGSPTCKRWVEGMSAKSERSSPPAVQTVQHDAPRAAIVGRCRRHESILFKSLWDFTGVGDTSASVKVLPAGGLGITRLVQTFPGMVPST